MNGVTCGDSLRCGGGEKALCGMVVALSSLRMAAYVPQSLATGNVVGGFLSPMFWGVWIAPTFIFLLWMGTVDRSPMEVVRRSASSQLRVNDMWLWCAAVAVSGYYSALYAVLCRVMSGGALPAVSGFWPLSLFVQTLLALVVLGIGDASHGCLWRCMGGRVMPVMLAAVVFEYLIREPSQSVFLGCFGSPDDTGDWPLLANKVPLAFLVFGMLIILEWPCSVLLSNNAMTCVRRRGVCGKVRRYLIRLAAYCLAFTGVPLLLTVGVVGGWGEGGSLICTAVCAALQLLLAIAIRDAGTLLGNRAVGYVAALMLCMILESAKPVESWLMADSYCGLPHWLIVLSLASMMVIASPIPLCRRMEII